MPEQLPRVDVVKHGRGGGEFDVVIDGRAVIRDPLVISTSRSMRDWVAGDASAPAAELTLALTFRALPGEVTERAEGAALEPVARIGDRVLFTVEALRDLTSAALPWDVVALELVGISRRDDGVLELRLAQPDDRGLARGV